VNPIFLDRNIFIYTFSETIVWVLLLLSMPLTLTLLRHWNFSSFTTQQFRLERRAYLLMSIAVFVFVLKLLLFPYFIFTIDKMSMVVPGAMCAAGVISFDGTGMHLLYVKIAVLFVLVLWLVINYYDIARGDYRWSVLKYRLFVLIFLLISTEFWLTLRFFNALDIHAVLNCCSTLYGLLEGMNPLPFGLDKTPMVTLFYLTWLWILFSHAAQKQWSHLSALVLFVPIGYYSVLYFFGTYIYELPGHHCPFCMFQRDYWYVGYAVWGLFAGGLFAGAAALFAEIFMHEKAQRIKHFSSWMLSLFVLLCTAYVLSYVARNGTLLPEELSTEMAMPM
jgi:hypothetical protein